MMRKYMILLLTGLLLGTFSSFGQTLLICNAENFENYGNLIDNDPGTTTNRIFDPEGDPGSICVQPYHCNFIESFTINIKQENRANFIITVSDRQLDYNDGTDYYRIIYSYAYKNNGETGDIKVEVNEFASYIQLWELDQGTLELGGLSVVSDMRYRYLNFTYDDSGNRIRRRLAYTANKSAKELEELDPEQFDLGRDSHILLYPNPTSGIMNFEVIDPEMQTNPKIDAKLYSVNGRMILEEEFNESYFTIDISDRQNGTYLLDLKVNGKKQYFTIIKQ